MLTPRLTLLLALAALLAAFPSATLQAQGFYYRTAQRNPMTGRQEIVDLQRPRWTGAGQGGFMFDPAIGSMQIAAVSRSRATGRLEYYNRYMNPWTGAQYMTATQFNPYSGRYETLHQIEPPPPPPAPLPTAQPNTEAAPVAEVPPVKVRPRLRVIETRLDGDAPPAVVPGATAPDFQPAKAEEQQDQSSSRTIQWNQPGAPAPSNSDLGAASGF